MRQLPNHYLIDSNLNILFLTVIAFFKILQPSVIKICLKRLHVLWELFILLNPSLIVAKNTILEVKFGNLYFHPFIPFIGESDDLFDEFFLIVIDGAAKSEVFEDFFDEF